MKKLFQIGLLLLLATPVAAQESSRQNPPKVLRTYDWKDLNVQPPNTNCQIQIVSMDGTSVLKIENTANKFFHLSLLTITNSTLIKNTDAIVCEIKYENVRPSIYNLGGRLNSGGQLNLFTISPPLAIGGDAVTNFQSNHMLIWSSNWERLELKVHANAVQNQPTKMEYEIFLPSTGTVYLRPIKLLGTAESSNWWSPQQVGRIGGIGGAIIGCLGGLIGVLASRGKARKFVLALTKIFIVLGIFLLFAGAIAAALKQPYAVYYPLLLAGFILTIVFSVNLSSIQRRYDELEIRRMTSLDAS